MGSMHTGRCGYRQPRVAPPRIKSPIPPFAPRELSARGIERRATLYTLRHLPTRPARPSSLCREANDPP